MFSFSFWHKWLLGLSGLIILFGVGMALTSGTSLFNLFHNQVAPVFWGRPRPTPPCAASSSEWVYAVLGATMLGWGMFLAFMVFYAFKKREPWSWVCISLGLGLWFMLDTAVSAWCRVTLNVLFMRCCCWPCAGRFSRPERLERRGKKKKKWMKIHFFFGVLLLQREPQAFDQLHPVCG